jgi:hypothetical protein
MRRRLASSSLGASLRKIGKRRACGGRETFDFFGLTHYCGTLRSGKFTVKHKTCRSFARISAEDVLNRCGVEFLKRVTELRKLRVAAPNIEEPNLAP